MFNPQYTLTHKILNNLLRIAEIKSLVAHTPILPKEQAKLRRQALISMVHSSTSIEGNPLARFEVERIIVGDKIDAPGRDIHEIKNYQDALWFIDHFSKGKKKITTSTILEIHRLLTKNTIDKEKCGCFRKDKVYVVKLRGLKTEIVYTGPKANRVPKLVEDLVNWLIKTEKENLCPPIAAGLAHYELASIHPFADGNGRTARALAALVLWSRGYDFKKLFALEDYYNKDRQAYYKAIHTGKTYQARRGRDLIGWLDYFIEGFRVSMEQVERKIIPLSVDFKVRRKLGGPVYLDKTQARILDFLITTGTIDSRDVARMFRVNKRTAQRYLNTLAKTKLIRRQGKGPATFYTLNI